MIFLKTNRWTPMFIFADRKPSVEVMKRALMTIQKPTTCNWKYYWNVKFTFAKNNARKFYASKLSFCENAAGGTTAGPCKVC